MLPILALEDLTSDATILFTRALLNKEVSCFGEDGNGLHGTNDRAKFFTVDSLRVIINEDIDENLTGILQFHLDGYHEAQCGAAVTDNNLRISLNKLFAAEIIDSKDWSWAPLKDQGDEFVAINFDVYKVLGW
jgi:hypothetical protein